MQKVSTVFGDYCVHKTKTRNVPVASYWQRRLNVSGTATTTKF
jgi:hypothetical protein